MARIELVLRGTAETQARLRAIPEQMSRAMKKAMSDSIVRVYRRALENLTGRVLHVKTGRLRQSLQTSVSTDGSSASIGTNVEYARIHEFGGTTRPHDILPTRKQALAWSKGFIGFGAPRRLRSGRLSASQRPGARIQFASSVLHPGAHVPARPYLRPALRDSMEEIRAIFEREGGRAARGQA